MAMAFTASSQVDLLELPTYTCPSIADWLFSFQFLRFDWLKRLYVSSCQAEKDRYVPPQMLNENTPQERREREIGDGFPSMEIRNH